MNPKNRLASSLGSFLRALCDLMILNLLWVFCSLPVFTIGPAASALCRVSVRLVRDESSSVLSDFFQAFRRDFLKAVILGVIGLAGIAVAGTDYYFAVNQSGGMRILFLVVAVLVSTVVMSYLSYVFLLHAFYENSIGAYIRNALALAVTAPAETLRIWVCFAIPILAFLFLPEAVLIYAGFLYVLFAGSVPAWFAARRQVKVLARFDGTQTAKENNNQ
ncbi:MAG: DUF624 domain-containing protein [Oscillospiraceae bacterium]|nr:DUF624 domain-containing protein [Oscillospiraceae bacterium]